MVAILDTGQTTCYNANTSITCPSFGESFYGQDANYTINAPSYTDNGTTITNNVTDLIWQKEDDNNTRNWSEAGTYCDALTLGSNSDWRLPTKKELMRIANFETYNPAINLTYFPNTNSSYYWSSIAYSSNTSRAWLVSFNESYVFDHNKSSSYNYVRCVRGDLSTSSFTDNGYDITNNESGLMWQKEDDNTTRNWETALSYCEGLTLGSKSDWRLPDINELESITDDSTHSPSINSTYFPNTNSLGYWSSTTYVDSTSNAWIVDFNYGEVTTSPKSNSNFFRYVRCVRGGM